MPSFSLLLLWIGSGFIIGALALAARFKPANWSKRGWLWLLLLTTCSGLLGGLLGFWLFGRAFATSTAVWIAVLASFVPQFANILRDRLRS